MYCLFVRPRGDLLEQTFHTRFVQGVIDLVEQSRVHGTGPAYFGAWMLQCQLGSGRTLNDVRHPQFVHHLPPESGKLLFGRIVAPPPTFVSGNEQHGSGTVCVDGQKRHRFIVRFLRGMG